MNHLSDHAITIGMVTEQHLQKLVSNGDISTNHQKFYAGVRAFYVDAASQALKKLPFDDHVPIFWEFQEKINLHLRIFLHRTLRFAAVHSCTNG